MGEKSRISWCDSTWNPWYGCRKISEGCKNCLDPDTLILYDDWVWRPLKNACVGDRLIGFNESGKGIRRLERTFIEAIRYVIGEAVRIRTEHTQIVSSYDHRFLSAKPGRWLKAGHFRLRQTKLCYIGEWACFDNDLDYMAGYIAGMTAGDGTMRRRGEAKQCYWRVAVTDVEILERLKNYLSAFGIELKIMLFSKATEKHREVLKIETRRNLNIEAIYKIINRLPNIEFQRGWLAGIFDAEGSHQLNGARASNLRIANTNRWILKTIIEYGKQFDFDFQIEAPKKPKIIRLYGSSLERGRFLGIVRPALRRKIDGLLGFSVSRKSSSIEGLEHLTKRHLIDIQTSTGTFYANGLATHNCYMFRDMPRYGKDPNIIVRAQDATFYAPIKKKGFGPLVFVNSWGDFFSIEADKWRNDAWEVIRKCPHLTFLILTKRAERIAGYLPDDWGQGRQNVWLGISAENQKNYDERILWLNTINTVLRFVSLEPLLARINLRLEVQESIDWVITGGESGFYDRRKCYSDWVRSIRDQCIVNDTLFFFKQWGGDFKDDSGIWGGCELDGRVWNQRPSVGMQLDLFQKQTKNRVYV